MGILGSIFVKENSNIKGEELYRVLERICSVKNLFVEINSTECDKSNKMKVIRTNVSDKPLDEDIKRQLCVDIFDEPFKYRYNSFDWFDRSIVFFEIITIDFFVQNEDLLFKIVYELLKLYPDAKLWMEQDWFYTLEDLEKLDKGTFCLDWCYKKP